MIDRVNEHADQQAGHLHSDGAEDDAADPSLGLHNASRLDRDHLPDKRAHECEGANAAGQSLREAGPDLDQVLQLIHQRLVGKRAPTWVCT